MSTATISSVVAVELNKHPLAFSGLLESLFSSCRALAVSSITSKVCPSLKTLSGVLSPEILVKWAFSGSSFLLSMIKVVSGRLGVSFSSVTELKKSFVTSFNKRVTTATIVQQQR